MCIRDRDKAVHLEVIRAVIGYACSIGYSVKNLEFSPIKGPEGNIEYLLYLNNKEEDPCVQPPVAPDEIVELAHAALQG